MCQQILEKNYYARNMLEKKLLKLLFYLLNYIKFFIIVSIEKFKSFNPKIVY